MHVKPPARTHTAAPHCGSHCHQLRACLTLQFLWRQAKACAPPSTVLMGWIGGDEQFDDELLRLAVPRARQEQVGARAIPAPICRACSPPHHPVSRLAMLPVPPGYALYPSTQVPREK